MDIFCKNLDDFILYFFALSVILPIYFLVFYLFYMRFILRFILTAAAIYGLIHYGYLSGITFASGNTSLLVFTGVLSLVNLIV